VEVPRLAFVPKSVRADGRPLPKRGDLRANGYTVKRPPNGDAIVSIRHDGRHNLAVAGDGPQATLAEDALAYEGGWTAEARNQSRGPSPMVFRVSARRPVRDCTRGALDPCARILL